MRLSRGSEGRPRRRRFGRHPPNELANSRTHPELASVADDLAAQARATESTPRGSYELGLAIRRAIVEHNLRDRALIDIARRLSDPRPDARLGVGAALQQLGALAHLWARGPQAAQPAAPSTTVAEPPVSPAKSPPRGRSFARTGLAWLGSKRSRASTLVVLSVGGLAAIALVAIATAHQATAPMTATNDIALPRSGSASTTPITAPDRLAPSTRDSPAGKCGELLSVDTTSVDGSLSKSVLLADGPAVHVGSRRLAVDDPSARAVVGDWDGDGAVGPGFIAATWVALWRDVSAAGMATTPDAFAQVEVVTARVDDLNGDGRDEIVAVDPGGAVVVVDLRSNCLVRAQRPPRIS